MSNPNAVKRKRDEGDYLRGSFLKGHPDMYHTAPGYVSRDAPDNRPYNLNKGGNIEWARRAIARLSSDKPLTGKEFNDIDKHLRWMRRERVKRPLMSSWARESIRDAIDKRRRLKAADASRADTSRAVAIKPATKFKMPKFPGLRKDEVGGRLKVMGSREWLNHVTANMDLTNPEVRRAVDIDFQRRLDRMKRHPETITPEDLRIMQTYGDELQSRAERKTGPNADAYMSALEREGAKKERHLAAADTTRNIDHLQQRWMEEARKDEARRKAEKANSSSKSRKPTGKSWIELLIEWLRQNPYVAAALGGGVAGTGLGAAVGGRDHWGTGMMFGGPLGSLASIGGVALYNYLKNKQASDAGNNARLMGYCDGYLAARWSEQER